MSNLTNSTTKKRKNEKNTEDNIFAIFVLFLLLTLPAVAAAGAVAMARAEPGARVTEEEITDSPAVGGTAGAQGSYPHPQGVASVQTHDNL